MNQIREQPLLVIFYAFGYATGNVVGIMVERKLAFGMVVLRVISRNAGQAIAEVLRDKGQSVTIFMGEGMRGPVALLYFASRRRDMKWIIPEVTAKDPKAFYVLEAARDVSHVLKPTMAPIGGLRALSKTEIGSVFPTHLTPSIHFVIYKFRDCQGHLELAESFVVGTGKGAFSMTESFAFDQSFGDDPAVNDHKGTILLWLCHWVGLSIQPLPVSVSM